VTDGGDSVAGPPKLDRVRAAAPGASRGLGAAEVTAAAALAAGLPREGSLADDGPLRLCYLAAAGQATGRLDLETDRGTFALFFKRGVVEHAASSAAEDDLGRFLVARGAVRAEAVEDARRVLAYHDGDLVTALASLQLMNPAESFRVLQEHGTALVARALGADRGRSRWDPAARPPPSSFPFGSRWGVLCDGARRLDGLAVRKLLGERLHRAAARAGGRVELTDLKLTAHEARAAALFDGARSPAELAAAYPPDAETILRVALLLAETELLAFGEAREAPAATPVPGRAATSPPTSTAASSVRPEWMAAESKGAPASPPTPTATSAPTSAPARSPARAATSVRPERSAAESKGGAAAPPAPPRARVPTDPVALRAFHDRILIADHFDALGVKRDTPHTQVKLAYFQLAKSYHPDAAPASEPPEVKKLRADIFARLGEAWGVLGDEARRAEYVAALAAGGAADVDISAIFKAEETFQKAVVLVRTRQYDRALAALREAIALNADEAEFGVWMAWVEFLVAPDQASAAPASVAAIEAALKKNPRCLPGYLFLGQMAKLRGDVPLAEKHLRRGLALAPDHADLLRELKYLSRK
jgi:tetratricopeptide (TPR) repeat protein